MRRAVLVAAAATAAVFAAGAGAAVTSYDANGTVLVEGKKVFPIVLAKGPERGTTTPAGVDALTETIGAGVNFFKVGPATTPWSDADIADANLWDQALAGRGAYTWINLSTLSQAAPGSPTDALLQKVLWTLLSDPAGSAGIGMWKGADEPWWSGIAPSALQFAYCRATHHGDPSWCGGERSLDQGHLWVTIEAPRGTAGDLAPYGAVTLAHGVDDYPVTLSATDPDLHQVGVWTSTLASVTPGASVWTTLQICASGSYDGHGNFVLPTRLQERYMIYDAILNGARNLAFYGGNNHNCWNAADTTYGWSWTFWNDVLKGLIQEINGSSPLAPALVNPGSTRPLATSDSTTEVISRQGSSPSDLWVIAARSGTGSQPVTISGLPASVTSGSVYTEGRTVSVSGGSFTDTFGRWDVHVYHFDASTPAAPAPTLSSFAPGEAAVGTTIALTGTNLTGASAVMFNGAKASFEVTSDFRLTATVPGGATSGLISVTAPGGTATSTSSFTVTPRHGTAAASSPTAEPSAAGGTTPATTAVATPTQMRATRWSRYLLAE